MGMRAHLVAATMLLGAAAVAGCAPVPVERAERSCLEAARDASAPRGEIAMGVGTNGHSVHPMGRVSVSVSSDYLMQRDPAEAFDRCVLRRSGQMPTRPLHEQPGWRG